MSDILCDEIVTKCLGSYLLSQCMPQGNSRPPQPLLHLMFRLRRRNKQKSGRNEGENILNYSLPQELLDECLSHLSSHTDFMACALVCRSWSSAAQRLLFRVVYVSSRRYKRLEKTLRTSPHLASNIRTLVLSREEAQLKAQAFTKVCCLPGFTHLTNISIHHRCPISSEVALALQQLFSLPTLRRLALEYRSAEPAAFRALWNHCSPSLRHLHLTCFSSNHSFGRPTLPTQYHFSAAIALESLRVDRVDSLSDWLTDDGSCPFDLSQLAILSVKYDISKLVLEWPRMTPSFQTLEALEFDGRDEINLSLLPNLLFLRIQQRHSASFPSILSTITVSSRIQQIVLSIVYLTVNQCDELDYLLAKLPMRYPPTVGLEMNVEEYTRWAESFPRLHSRLLLHRTDLGWFEAQLHRRNSLH
ncbi:hypothetical protein MSAN_01452500 [Mycena sanguinolenta]|uniref:F-box domain-containing protein n=1 Tax=Mycena sanguinolenta TaxID=230812 RepID=A0A8H7CYK1_9AGAR|nr:hypothetical protein MSAN_01452500 [Mycena sanguinolenta]